MDELKWLEVAVNTTADRLDELSGKLNTGKEMIWNDPGLFKY